MTFLSERQRTPEWFAQRKLRVTGSRAGAILGLSPWQSADDVLRAMVREHHGAPSEFVDNPAVQHGRLHEKRALLAFMRESEHMVEECGFFEYGDKFGASPDGLTDDGGVLELKVPFSCRHGEEFKTLSEQPHYYAQVQMEMLATGRSHAYFAQYTASPEHINIERVSFDQAWVEENMPKLEAFHGRVLSELDNPAHLEPLRVEVVDDVAARLVTEIYWLRAEQKKMAAEEADKLASLVKVVGCKDADINGSKLTLVKRQGSISYAKAIAELAPDADLEKWRGAPSESWRLT